MEEKENTRLYYLDNIKAICIFSLFIWHTCEVFHCKEGFYVEGKDTLFFTLMYCFASPWLMSVMFLISGMSTMLSLKKRSMELFYSDRIKRVVVPVFAGVLLWIPLEAFFCLKNHTDYAGGMVEAYLHFFTHIDYSMYGYDGSFTPSQLWFMCFLIVYIFLFYPIIAFVKRNSDIIAEKKIMSWKTIAICVIATLLLSYGSTEETFLAFAFFFGFGIVLYNNKSFFEFLDKNWKLLLILGLIFNACASPALIHIRDIGNIWGGDYALCRLIWSIGRVTGAFATIGVGQKFMNVSTNKWKYFVKNSYNYYFLHMQVLICVAYIVVTYIDVAVGIQWGIIFILSIIATIVVVEVMKRIKIFRGLFGLNA